VASGGGGIGGAAAGSCPKRRPKPGGGPIAADLASRGDDPFAGLSLEAWLAGKAPRALAAGVFAGLCKEVAFGLPLVLAGVEALFGPGKVALVSSPCGTDGCMDGKRDWVARHCPRLAKSLFLGSRKDLLAGPCKVLLDDRDENCAAFALAGGVAITVPRPWNSRRDETDAQGRFDVTQILGEAGEAREAALRGAARGDRKADAARHWVDTHLEA
jgi:hypothetical protein